MREAPPPRAMEAQPGRQEQRRPRRDDGLADSVRRIERSTRGRVINAERVQSDGRSINRIKVMDDRGRIRVYMDDPQARTRAPTRGDDQCASNIPQRTHPPRTVSPPQHPPDITADSTRGNRSD